VVVVSPQLGEHEGAWQVPVPLVPHAPEAQSPLEPHVAASPQCGLQLGAAQCPLVQVPEAQSPSSPQA
jgi:hypothetical protein